MSSDYSLKISQIAKKYGGRDEFIQVFFEANAGQAYEFVYSPPSKWLYIPLFHRMGNSVNYSFKLFSKYDETTTFNQIRRTNALKGVLPFPLYTPVKHKVRWKIENTDATNSHTFDTVEQGVIIPIKNERKFFAELRGEFLLLANLDSNIQKLGQLTSQALRTKDVFTTVSEDMGDLLQKEEVRGSVIDDRYSATRNAPKSGSVIEHDGNIYPTKKKKKPFLGDI